MIFAVICAGNVLVTCANVLVTCGNVLVTITSTLLAVVIDFTSSTRAVNTL